jgi:2,4-dienoyl-CoA reductase-like NADH-dependent reductase (Old Yellow Enzyme family)
VSADRQQQVPVSADALFTPMSIGNVEVPNRIVLPPMTTRLADDEGNVTDALIAYYRARALGGVGLITVEMSSPEQVGRHRARELKILSDEALPGLRRLVDAVHATGTGPRLSIQLGHAGSRAPSRVSGEQPIAPTAIPTTVYEVESATQTPLEMSEARIAQTTDAFVDAARRVQSAGFDMVELHASHGYLISQFLTPYENRRTDRFGGSLVNRARFGLDILRRIKAEVPGLPVIFRVGVEDFFEGGLRLQEGVQVGIWAAECGADAVSVSAGHYRSLPSAERMIPPMEYAEATFVDFAARVKDRVDVPVIGVGRLGDPAQAQRALADGKLDFVALGRPLLADPEWPNKARAAVPVRRCLSCNHCVDTMRGGERISCVVNPITGRELDFAGAEPPQREKIVVIGAGPAGLSYASLVAGVSDVTVLERAPAAGGALRYAGKAPRFNGVRADEAALLAYVAELERECRRKGARFHYGADVGAHQTLVQAADRVVVATGARYRLGAGPAVRWVLETGLAKSRLGVRLFASERVRDWLYYRVRAGTGAAVARRLHLHPDKVTVIGDAGRAGKAREAIAAAFEAALLPPTPYRSSVSGRLPRLDTTSSTNRDSRREKMRKDDRSSGGPRGRR